jgi:hypothetical protein
VVQTHLPGTVPEITDPLPALILSVMLGLSERLQNSPSNSLAGRATTQIGTPAPRGNIHNVHYVHELLCQRKL